MSTKENWNDCRIGKFVSLYIEDHITSTPPHQMVINGRISWYIQMTQEHGPICNLIIKVDFCDVHYSDRRASRKVHLEEDDDEGSFSGIRNSWKLPLIWLLWSFLFSSLWNGFWILPLCFVLNAFCRPPAHGALFNHVLPWWVHVYSYNRFKSRIPFHLWVYLFNL